MVPFIDIVLVLLIIFMITAPILQSGIELDVPKTKIVKEINEQKVVVSIDKKQLVYLGNDPVNVVDLGAKDSFPAQAAERRRLPSLRRDRSLSVSSRRSLTPSSNPASRTSASSPNRSPTALALVDMTRLSPIRMTTA